MSRKKKTSISSIPMVFPTASIEQLENIIKSFEKGKYPAFAFLKDELIRNHINEMICLGIGDPCRFISSRSQLSFIIALKKEANISSIEFYDPDCCDSCLELLKTHGFSITPINLEGKYKFAERRAFFLPHCPLSLINNLIRENTEFLSDMCLIVNSFAEQTRISLQNKQKPDLLENISLAGLIEEFPLDFNADDCFDRLSLIFSKK